MENTQRPSRTGGTLTTKLSTHYYFVRGEKKGSRNQR